MKRGYYVHFQGRMSIGVSKKIDMQMEEFKKNYEMKEIEVETFQRNLAERIIGLFPTCSIKRNYAQAIEAIDDPDFLYIRRAVADKAYVGFLRQIKEKYPKCRIVIEIFTYPYDKDDFGKWNAWPFYFKELIYRKKLKKYVDRFVTYTKDEEIFGIPTICTVNGIDVDKIKMVEGNYYDDKITMIGVAYMQRQHGYERVIEGLNNYYRNPEAKYKVYLNLVGDGPEKEKYKKMAEKYQLQEYVTFFDTTTGRDLDKLYDAADIALSAFGMYKVGFYKAVTALKTRECLAKGIPMISGSPIDVLDENYEYALIFPNDDSPVDIYKVIEFYQKIRKSGRSKTEIAALLREDAYKTVNIDVAMKPIEDFIGR